VLRCCAVLLCCRGEKNVLNNINHSKDPQQLRYHVMARAEMPNSNSNKLKERISTPAEKLYILVRCFDTSIILLLMLNSLMFRATDVFAGNDCRRTNVFAVALWLSCEQMKVAAWVCGIAVE
jgi:hypothetical protein